jgi:hypothetical protein
MNLYSKNNIVGSNYWVNSENKTFPELVKDNHQLFTNWGNSEIAFNEKYINKILKPLNSYSEIFSIKPEIIINNNNFYLRYYTHAEIWVEPREDGIYALDKCWQTQFYPSDKNFILKKDCYKASYKFYVPWMIDSNCSLKVFSIEDSPFVILNDKINFTSIAKKNILDCHWFYFSIKSIGNHIEQHEDDIYSIIKIKTPICDILIDNESIIERLMNER